MPLLEYKILNEPKGEQWLACIIAYATNAPFQDRIIIPRKLEVFSLRNEGLTLRKGRVVAVGVVGDRLV